MQIHQEIITFRTLGRGIVDITSKLAEIVSQSNIQQGICHVFLAHTSASLIFCENADPVVCRDLEAFIARLVPDGDPLFLHNAEGPDDMPSHIRTVLTQNALSVPIIQSRLALGTWQGLFLWEHRTAPHQRQVTLTIIGK